MRGYLLLIVCALGCWQCSQPEQGPVFQHISRGNVAEVRAALDAGFDINAIDPIDEYGHTPLCLASESDDTAVFQLLVEKGAALESPCEYQTNLLYRLAARGRPEHIRIVVAAGLDVRQKSPRGKTALYEARDLPTFLTLLELGLTVEDAHRDFGLSLSRANVHNDIALWLLNNTDLYKSLSQEELQDLFISFATHGDTRLMGPVVNMGLDINAMGNKPLVNALEPPPVPGVMKPYPANFNTIHTLFEMGLDPTHAASARRDLANKDNPPPKPRPRPGFQDALHEFIYPESKAYQERQWRIGQNWYTDVDNLLALHTGDFSAPFETKCQFAVYFKREDWKAALLAAGAAPALLEAPQR